MLEGIFLAIVQAAAEFLPISSSGHLVFVSKLISYEPNLFFFSALHAASLLAILIFTRDEITHLIRFDKGYRKLWLYLIVAVIPASLVGLFFRERIKELFSSLFFVGIFFIFTAGVLYSTKFRRDHRNDITLKSALLIGLLQVLGLFPGISRSGTTISTALILGIEKKKAIKFSFLLFIPLAVGALVLNAFANNEPMAGAPTEIGANFVVSFLVCLGMSLVFLNMMLRIVEKGKLWLFSAYCLSIGLISFLLHFLL